jgi:hypothetical protein
MSCRLEGTGGSSRKDQSATKWNIGGNRQTEIADDTDSDNETATTQKRWFRNSRPVRLEIAFFHGLGRFFKNRTAAQQRMPGPLVPSKRASG